MECKLEKIFLDNITGADSYKLIQCLRTYATIGKHHRAEELFCIRVVLPYMEEVGIHCTVSILLKSLLMMSS